MSWWILCQISQLKQQPLQRNLWENLVRWHLSCFTSWTSSLLLLPPRPLLSFLARDQNWSRDRWSDPELTRPDIEIGTITEKLIQLPSQAQRSDNQPLLFPHAPHKSRKKHTDIKRAKGRRHGAIKRCPNLKGYERRRTMTQKSKVELRRELACFGGRSTGGFLCAPGECLSLIRRTRKERERRGGRGEENSGNEKLKIDRGDFSKSFVKKTFFYSTM